MGPLTVYFNSACPVCRAGIAAQRQRMRATEVTWIDVHVQPDAVDHLASSLEQVREQLHVQTPDGVLHIGADAFAVLLRHTPHWRWLGRLLRLPGLHGACSLAYRLFARRLYRWNLARGHWQPADATLCTLAEREPFESEQGKHT